MGREQAARLAKLNASTVWRAMQDSQDSRRSSTHSKLTAAATAFARGELRRPDLQPAADPTAVLSQLLASGVADSTTLLCECGCERELVDQQRRWHASEDWPLHRSALEKREIAPSSRVADVLRSLPVARRPHSLGAPRATASSRRRRCSRTHARPPVSPRGAVLWSAPIVMPLIERTQVHLSQEARVRLDRFQRYP